MVNLHIGLANAAHIEELARLHFESLPDDYLPSLGLDFLRGEYYPAALKSANAATFIASAEEMTVGFVTVASNSTSFAQSIMQGRRTRLVGYAIRAMLHNPSHILKSAQVFWASAFGKPDPIQGEIVFIAVHAAYRNCGIGKQLILHSLDYLYNRGIMYCRTKTLARNTTVIALYSKLGWHVRDRFDFIGKHYVTLVGNCHLFSESSGKKSVTVK